MKPGTRRTTTGTYGVAVRTRKVRGWIHAAWAKTGQDDATYRAMLMAVAGVDTSLKLDLAAAHKVLDHINKLTGRTAQRLRDDRPALEGHACEPQLRKIEALLADQKLPWAFILRSKSAGKPPMVKRLAGVDNLLWATPQGLSAIITALTVRAQKQEPRP